MPLGKAAPRVEDDPAPALGGSLDTNGQEILFADGVAAVFGAGSDGSINFDGTDLEFDVVAGANFEFNLPGAGGARTSKLLVTGNSGPAGGQPLVEIVSATSTGNARVLKIVVNSVTKFAVDNEGDVECGSSIAAGNLYFLGSVDPVAIYTAANNGMVFGAFHASPARSKAKFGLGSLGQKTLTAAIDQDDHVIVRDVDGASAYAEAGSVLRLERDVTNVTAENGNFLECGGLNGAGLYSRIDKQGMFRWFERSADPTEPAEGEAVVWMSDGTGKGDDGDVLIASKAGGVTKWGTLFDHSAGAAW